MSDSVIDKDRPVTESGRTPLERRIADRRVSDAAVFDSWLGGGGMERRSGLDRRSNRDRRGGGGRV